MKITRFTTRVKDRSYSNIRLYLVPDEESLYDNFVQGRLTRPHVEFRKSKLLERFLRDTIGYSPPLPKVRWSGKAGCACGCSPGFIVEGSAAKPEDYFIYYDPLTLIEPVKVDEDTYSARVMAIAKMLAPSIDIIE